MSGHEADTDYELDATSLELSRTDLSGEDPLLDYSNTYVPTEESYL